MRQLLAAYSALSAHKHGDTLEVIKGTTVREVSPEYLTAKKELLENGDLNNPASIKASLAAFEEKWRRLLRKRAAKLKAIKGKGVLKIAGTSAYARELTHSLTSCLNALSRSAPADDDASDLEEDLAALVSDPTSYLDADEDTVDLTSDVADDVSSAGGDEVDYVWMALPTGESRPIAVSATAKSRPVELPDWATGYLNHRGLVPLSPSHFYGVAAFNGSVTDALLDTGGGRSMMDLATARKLGLPV